MSVTWQAGFADPSGIERLPRTSQPSPTTPTTRVELRFEDDLSLTDGRPADDQLKPADLRRLPDRGDERLEVPGLARLHPRTVADPGRGGSFMGGSRPCPGPRRRGRGRPAGPRTAPTRPTPGPR